MEHVIFGRSGGEPVCTVGQRAIYPGVEELARSGFVGTSADVLESPGEREHAPVVVDGPAAVLVAADALFKPAHERKQSNIGQGAGGVN